MATSSGGVEGEEIVLASPKVEIGPNECIEFDLYLVLSSYSTENVFAIYIKNETFENIHKIYQITAWTHSGWKKLRLQLPIGEYELIFAFIMGIPYKSVAAMDNIIVKQCEEFDTGYIVGTGLC